MSFINENYLKLEPSYLFRDIAQKVASYSEQNPGHDIIKLGIGDVTIPLSNTIINAIIEAAREMGKNETFRGYGPERGYSFVLQKIIENDYKPFGVELEENEIFLSDGSKCDSANVQEIFSSDAKIAVGNPVYPVYLDTNIMAGRDKNITFITINKENNFIPELPKSKVDIIYLCYPNNPTGTVLTKDELTRWVNYAHENKSVILYDAAYEAFITEEDIPHSIYEIEGAKEVAIEFRSFSKTAGFTGVRCAYIVVPNELKGYTSSGEAMSLNQLWNRRHSTKFNGVSYITQKAAEACYSKLGKEEIRKNIDYYLYNAKLLKKSLTNCGYEAFGGINSPYIWIKTPYPNSSWDFFDVLLKQAQIVGTPGSGFGKAGEGYFRLSAFAKLEDVKEAIIRINMAI